MAHAATKPGHFTYGDYCTWPDEERWELIDGEAYNMTPAPSRLHQEFLVELARQVANFLRGKPCRVYVAPFDVRLPEGQEADAQVSTVLQPDLAVICDRARLDDKGCRGAPDWVIEILSPSTASKDMIKKRHSYERHGVREYWLVHPVDRVVTLYRRGEQGFGPPDIQALEGGTPVAILPGLEIQWAAVLEED